MRYIAKGPLIETGMGRSRKTWLVFLSAALGTSIGMPVVEALKLGIIACKATISHGYLDSHLLHDPRDG